MSDTNTKAPFNGPTMRFLFNISNDLAETRRFYTELIGLKETQYEAEWGYLNYQCEGFEFMFFKSENGTAPTENEWAEQPGYASGKREVTSWAILIPHEQYSATVARLKVAGVKQYSANPEWRQNSYWGFTVIDPNGVTVEVYCMPTEKPESTEWVE